MAFGLKNMTPKTFGSTAMQQGDTPNLVSVVSFFTTTTTIVQSGSSPRCGTCVLYEASLYKSDDAILNRQEKSRPSLLVAETSMLLTTLLHAAEACPFWQ